MNLCPGLDKALLSSREIAANALDGIKREHELLRLEAPLHVVVCSID